MKHLFTLIICLAAKLIFAQAPMPFVNTPWTPKNIDSVKTIIGNITNGYTVSDQKIFNNAGVAYIYYKGANDKLIIVTLKKDLVGGDADMDIKPTAVIRSVNIEGLFVDIYPIFSKLLHPEILMEEVKEAGHVTSGNINFNGKLTTHS